MSGVKIEPFNVQLGGAPFLLNAFATGEACPQSTNPATDGVYLYQETFASTPVAGPTWDVDFGTAGAPQPTLFAGSNILTFQLTGLGGGLNVLNRDVFLAFLATYSGWDTGVCGVFIEVTCEGFSGSGMRNGPCIGLSNNAKTHLMWDFASGELINGNTVVILAASGTRVPVAGDVCRLTLRRSTYTTQISELLINGALVGSSTSASIVPTSATPKRLGLEFRGLNALETGTKLANYSNLRMGVI